MSSNQALSGYVDPYYWKTVWLLVKAEHRRRYSNSFLGTLWALLLPLTPLMIFSVIMPVITHHESHNYALYVLCTVPLWGFITTSVVSASASLLSQAETLKRCIISKSIFPIADVVRCARNYINLFFWMYILLLTLGFPGTWYALLLPLYLLPVVISVTAVAIGLAYVTPYIRDLRDFLALAMNIIGWFSAVPYPATLLPDNARSWLEWNPFYILMRPVIALIYEQTLPDMLMMEKLCGVTALSVIFGYALYRRCHRNFIYYL